MQRWIAAGVVVMMLFFGGGFYAYRTIKQNRPHPVWVPLPINPETPSAEGQRIAKELKEKLSDKDLLIQVSKDIGLPAKMGLANDSDAADELRSRLFVKVGEADSPMGKVPSINIGVSGKAKEKDVSGEIAMRLMKDVWKILGIKPPEPKK